MQECEFKSEVLIYQGYNPKRMVKLAKKNCEKLPKFNHTWYIKTYNVFTCNVLPWFKFVRPISWYFIILIYQSQQESLFLIGTFIITGNMVSLRLFDFLSLITLSVRQIYIPFFIHLQFRYLCIIFKQFTYYHSDFCYL